MGYFLNLWPYLRTNPAQSRPTIIIKTIPVVVLIRQKPGLTTHPAAQIYEQKKYCAVNQRSILVCCDPDWGRTSAAILGYLRCALAFYVGFNGDLRRERAQVPVGTATHGAAHGLLCRRALVNNRPKALPEPIFADLGHIPNNIRAAIER